jgi:hypothetical protein
MIPSCLRDYDYLLLRFVAYCFFVLKRGGCVQLFLHILIRSCLYDIVLFLVFTKF